MIASADDRGSRRRRQRVSPGARRRDRGAGRLCAPQQPVQPSPAARARPAAAARAGVRCRLRRRRATVVSRARPRPVHVGRRGHGDAGRPRRAPARVRPATRRARPRRRRHGAGARAARDAGHRGTARRDVRRPARGARGQLRLVRADGGRDRSGTRSHARALGAGEGRSERRCVRRAGRRPGRRFGRRELHRRRPLPRWRERGEGSAGSRGLSGARASALGCRRRARNAGARRPGGPDVATDPRAPRLPHRLRRSACSSTTAADEDARARGARRTARARVPAAVHGAGDLAARRRDGRRRARVRRPRPDRVGHRPRPRLRREDDPARRLPARRRRPRRPVAAARGDADGGPRPPDDTGRDRRAAHLRPRDDLGAGAHPGRVRRRDGVLQPGVDRPHPRGDQPRPPAAGERSAGAGDGRRERGRAGARRHPGRGGEPRLGARRRRRQLRRQRGLPRPPAAAGARASDREAVLPRAARGLARGDVAVLGLVDPRLRGSREHGRPGVLHPRVPTSPRPSSAARAPGR